MIIKNSNLRRELFSNRYLILAIMAAIIFLLLLINTLNNMTKESSNNLITPEQSIVKQTNTTPSQEIYTPEKTTISGSNVSVKKQEENKTIIDNFINYCNQKQIEQAYNLLTDDCKEEVFFSNIANFSNNYVNKVFNGKKTYSMQSWINRDTYTTYKIKIVDDMITTGKITAKENEIEDYYTVIQNGEEYKLNINGYIGKKVINKERTFQGIKITVISRDTYKDYESYDVKIENLNETTILLDSQEKTDSMYILASNESKYSAYSYEIDKSRLIIEPGRSRTITIHYNKTYSNQAITRLVVFGDIIKDYNEYNNIQNKKEYKDRWTISIDV